MYPVVGTFVLIRPAQTFYERIKNWMRGNGPERQTASSFGPARLATRKGVLRANIRAILVTYRQARGLFFSFYGLATMRLNVTKYHKMAYQ